MSDVRQFQYQISFCLKILVFEPKHTSKSVEILQKLCFSLHSYYISTLETV